MKESNIIVLPVITKLDIPADRVLESALGNVDRVLIMGWDKEGEVYFASSFADGGDVLWIMELCKKKLLEIEA